MAKIRESANPTDYLLKGTVQRYFNSVFDIYCIDRPRLKYELLLILNFFRNPHHFTTNTQTRLSSRGKEETLSEKLYFRKIFLYSRSLFRNIFLTQ
jgi:hypothetical protein